MKHFTDLVCQRAMNNDLSTQTYQAWICVRETANHFVELIGHRATNNSRITQRREEKEGVQGEDGGGNEGWGLDGTEQENANEKCE